MNDMPEYRQVYKLFRANVFMKLSFRRERVKILNPTHFFVDYWQQFSRALLNKHYRSHDKYIKTQSPTKWEFGDNTRGGTIKLCH